MSFGYICVWRNKVAVRSYSTFVLEYIDFSFRPGKWLSFSNYLDAGFVIIS
jgi:hypothetical protein